MNRDKLLASAQKHVRKGNWDRAIRDYRQIVDADPSDVRTLLKVADLHVKLGEFEDALHAYQQVAYHYASEDIYEKAVAVYKQALRVAPDNAHLHRDLGEAYFRHGRLKDALRVFHKAQKLFRSENDGINQRDVLERMVAIDPEDLGLQVQLAERYEKDGMRDKSLHYFRQAAEQLYEEGRLDEFVQVSERLVFLAPEEVERRKQIVRIYLDRNNNKHALKHLQLLFKDRPEDIETLELLGQTFARLGSKEKAVMVYQELARAFYKNGYEQRKMDTYRKILELDPNHEEARRALGDAARPRHDSDPGVGDTGNLEEPQDTDALDGIEFLDDDEDTQKYVDVPERVQQKRQTNNFLDLTDSIGDIGSEALSRIDERPGTSIGRQATEVVRDSDDIEDLPEIEIIAEADPTQDEIVATSSDVRQALTECEVFFKYKLFDRAEGVLTKLVASSPNNVAVREQMLRYYKLKGEDDGCASQLFQLARITATSPERARAYLKEALHYADPQIIEQRALQLGISLDQETLPPEASLDDLDLDFIDEISEGIHEASEVVEEAPEVAEDPSPSVVEFLPPDDEDEIEVEVAFTEELPHYPDQTDPERDTISPVHQVDQTFENLEESTGVAVVEPVDITDDVQEISLEDAGVELLEDDAMELVDDGGIELVESSQLMEPSELNEVEELALDDVEEVDLDLEGVAFDEDDFAALNEDEDEADFDFNITSDDADEMFDQLFGGSSDADDAFDSAFGGGKGLGAEQSEDLSPLGEVDFFIQQEMLSEAEDALEAIVEQDPDNEGIAARISKIASLRRKFEKMDNAFGTESLSRRFSPEYTTMAGELRPPELMNSNIEIGQDYFERGMVAEAIDEFKQALDDPDVKDDALYKIGICELERGDLNEAESVFKSLANDPGISDHIRRSALDHLNDIQRERA